MVDRCKEELKFWSWWQAWFLALWEILTFICCLYVAVSVPYNVTFAEKQENIGHLDLDAGNDGPCMLLVHVKDADLVKEKALTSFRSRLYCK